ncbi:hypothetical protein OHA21_04765 [Actinoplanes sp. NBC_00393]|uniref:hypothetical protein n=1 Tax=Actinoplanes sp. NBC_00393 TaxID=2975953 RepID=UPI002E201713
MTAGGWFTRERFGSPRRNLGAFVVFCGLVLFAVAGLVAGVLFVMASDACGSGDPQLICSTTGQNLAAGLPMGAALLGVLVGGAGLFVGRPLRTPLLVAGFMIVILGIVAGGLVAATGR